ncbi:MAG TPA: hypothetical protein VK616_14575 [Flavitalea sp.]|nr:hypothetical protein [Flavitalea sp.]
MKISHSIIILLLAGGLFAACNKSDIVHEDDFHKSYQTWLNFKTTSGNSYRYTVNTGSWTGSTTQMIVTVQTGKIVHRSYVIKTPQQNSNVLVIREQWEEDESTLNTHVNGGTSLTLDEIYEKARTEWVLKRKDATSYFEAKNDGMISSCGYVNNNCADDCFVGITINLIERL